MNYDIAGYSDNVVILEIYLTKNLHEILNIIDTLC